MKPINLELKVYEMDTNCNDVRLFWSKAMLRQWHGIDTQLDINLFWWMTDYLTSFLPKVVPDLPE